LRVRGKGPLVPFGQLPQRVSGSGRCDWH
jgi:hypothetical protein